MRDQLQRLIDALGKAEAERKQCIPSIISDEVLIFDVGQPKMRVRRNWAVLTEREKLEALLCSIPDFIFRDRIYVPPQYLSIHLRGTYYENEAFHKKVDRLHKLSLPHVAKIHKKQTSEKLDQDLTTLLTRWACANLLCAQHLYPGERVICNVPIVLKDSSCVFLKLSEDDFTCPYIVFTTETCNLRMHLNTVVAVWEYLEH
jgi:hypothetical protein